MQLNKSEYAALLDMADENKAFGLVEYLLHHVPHGITVAKEQNAQGQLVRAVVAEFSGSTRRDRCEWHEAERNAIWASLSNYGMYLDEEEE